MGRILSILLILVISTIALLSCSEPSGPLDVSNPTESILTVTLEEIGSLHTNTFTLERNGKGEYQTVAAWTQCPDGNFAWYTIYRSQTPGIASNAGAADTSVIFSSVSGTCWICSVV